MHGEEWQLKGRTAVLRLGGLSAAIATLRPGDGLVNLVAGGQQLAAPRLLGVVLGQAPDSPVADSIEDYVRGTDLVVAYDASSRRPLRVDVVWRAIAPTTSGNFLAAVDLIVSVRTHLLDIHPEVAVQSVVPSNEALRLRTHREATWEPLEVPDSAATVISPESGVGCLLFRLPNVDWSYVEMVHPADFQRDEISRGEPGDGTLRVAHQLFRMSLEKGVILRARVRGVFVKRRDDAQAALECYESFAAAEPPLGT
jgi:hypothetical protein